MTAEDEMQEKLFLFGTGKISERYTQILNWMSIKIEGYIDNDTSKWGTMFNGKGVCAPDVLRQNTSSYILIACAAREEIKKQITQMKFEKRIISFVQIIRQNNQNLFNRDIINADRKINSSWKKTIIIDNIYGDWGGAEDWCHIVTRFLEKKNNNVFLIENSEQVYGTGRTKENIIYADIRGNGALHTYKELLAFFNKMKPFVLINIWNSELLLAAATTIKYTYPGEVFILSNVLNDGSYEEWREWNEITDKYVCISSKIKRSLVEQYEVEESKVCYIPPFIEKRRKIDREYNSASDKPLKIGYPCRLSRNQKRADLIPKLIENLESKAVNYILNIAGDGPCKKEIEEYIDEKCLHKKVKLYGKLSKVDLIDFLNHQDVYLNFSEYEGTSLTMLEAMASGCVPVVTNVSGVDDFIESGINGLTADVGDFKRIIEHIIYLDKNRKLLMEYGRKCQEIIYRKCKLDEYIDRLENIVKSL